jgi:hypothetical protein
MTGISHKVSDFFHARETQSLVSQDAARRQRPPWSLKLGLDEENSIRAWWQNFKNCW